MKMLLTAGSPRSTWAIARTVCTATRPPESGSEHSTAAQDPCRESWETNTPEEVPLSDVATSATYATTSIVRPQTSTLRPGSPSAVGSVARTHPTEVRRRPLRAHLPSHVATKHLSDHRVRSTRLSPYRVCVTSKVCSLPISRLRHVAWCVGDLGGCVIIVRPRRGADE